VIDRRQIVIATKAPATASAPTWYVAAWISVPEGPCRPELLVLVHGANTDHRSWDFPIEAESYSFVRWALNHDYATLTIDRVGSGMSSHPPGAENTIDAQADVLHQVVEAVREGTDQLPTFSRIVLVGASLGSVVCGVEATRYGDVDAVVLSAYLPVDGGDDLNGELLVAMFEPAVRRKRELAGLIDDDYLLPKEDMGAAWLYRQQSADPAIIAAEEAMSGTTTRGELVGVADAGSVIRRSALPTLVLVGQFDPLLFDPSIEEDCHGSTARLSEISPENFEYRVVPETGHVLNLHRTAQHSFQEIGDWLDRRRAAVDGTAPEAQ
jgi:pimeloyl-ACP methyl ester carboxylesterase